MRMARAPYLARREMWVFRPTGFCGCFTTYCMRALYHVPRRTMMRAASRAARANHAMACWPKGKMMRAANRGPRAEPPLPPT